MRGAGSRERATGVVLVGLVSAGAAAFLECSPMKMPLFAVVGASLSSLIFFQQSRDFVKRVCLSLSAVGFRRVYGVGGVAAAISVALSLNSSIPMGNDSSWAWAVVAGLFDDTLDKIILAALAAPALAAFVSELAFLLILTVGNLEAVPNVLPVRTEETKEKASVERPRLQTDEFGQFPSTNRENRTTTKLRQLIPVEFHAGGLKQVVRSFLTETFKSSFFAYAPYSALVASDTSRSPAEGRRISILAKAGDAVDFEWIEFRGFQVKRITDSCYILVRKPLEAKEADRIEKAREERRRVAEKRQAQRT